MPYPGAFVRHTMLWTLTGGEVASCSVAWQPDAFVGPSAQDMDMLQAKALALWTGIKSLYSSSVQFIGSRAARVLEDGRIDLTLERIIAPVAGTAVGVSLPYEVSAVASLKTDVYGRRGRGRIYLPPPAASQMTANGRFVNTFTSTHVQQLDAYLAADTPTGMISRGASAAGVLISPVTVIEMGDVPDSQRRRRDALSEVYTSAAVDSTP
jgi:hypothetical protein